MNVLMIVVDDLRPPVSALQPTPNIDRLKAAGVSFSRAYTQIATCSPSRTSALTGLRPDKTHVWSIGPYFRTTMGRRKGLSTVTLPQLFKENGYNTTGSGKVFHPGSSSGSEYKSEGGGDMPYSWSIPYFFCDQFYNGTVQSTAAQGYPNGSGCVQSDECLACLEAEGAITDKKAKPAWSAPACPDDCLPDGLVATNVVAELEYAATHESARPFFIAAGMKRPHLGWFAPDTSYAKYPNGSVELAAHRTPPSGMPKLAFGDNGEMVAMDDIPVDDSSGYPLVVDWKQHELRMAYYSSVDFMDKSVGRVLDAMDVHGLWDSTVVVLWGDHGYHLGEQGIWCKSTNFEAGTRVPLVVATPDTASNGMGGTTSGALVELLDIYPTLVDLASLGSEAPTNLQGRSLRPLLESEAAPAGLGAGKPRSRREIDRAFSTAAYSQFARTSSNTLSDDDGIIGSVLPHAMMGLSVRTDEWRYTEWVHDWANRLDNGTVEKELYSHVGDPSGGDDPQDGAASSIDDFEFENLAGDPRYAVQEGELRKLLRAGPWGPWWFFHANDAENGAGFPLELTGATPIETAVGA